MKRLVLPPKEIEAALQQDHPVLRLPTGNYHPGEKVFLAEQWRIGAWRPPLFALDYRRPDGGWLPVQEWRFATGNYEDLIAETEADARAVMGDGPWVWYPGEGPARTRSAETMPAWAARAVLRILPHKDGDPAVAHLEVLHTKVAELKTPTSY